MIIRIHPSDPRPIYLQIMDEVRRALVMGTLAPEDPLPSVRQLAVQLRVNPNTVQQAYRELEREGWVYKRRGLGTFAAEVQTGQRERRALARELAKRMLREAFRQGLSAQELQAALKDVATGDSEVSPEKEKKA